MSSVKLLLLIVMTDISTVKANLNEIEPVEQTDIHKRKNVRDIFFCCLYRTQVWESSNAGENDFLEQAFWNSCNHPGVPQRGLGCFYSVSYDPKLKLFSLYSFVSLRDYGPNDIECLTDSINHLKCQDRPRSLGEVTTAARLFKRIRQQYMGLVDSKPKSSCHNDGNTGITCHNITNTDETNAMCVHVYDPVKQEFKFANRTCEGTQELVAWPSTKEGCFRYHDSWEYTCVSGGQGKVDYKKMLEDAKLPLTPVGCCSYFTIVDSAKKCKANSFMRVQPQYNVNCHFITQFEGTNPDDVKVLAMYTQEGVRSNTKCSLAKKSQNTYHCQCPVASLQESLINVRDVYLSTEQEDMRKRIPTGIPEDEEEESTWGCCKLNNLSPNNISQWNEQCSGSNLINKMIAGKQNDSCHYIMEKTSATEPINVLMMFQQGKVDPKVSCTLIKESGQLYDCHCPSSNDGNSNPFDSCLKGMFDQMKDFKVEPSQSCNQITTRPPQNLFCCNYTNILSNNTLSTSCSDDKQVKVDPNVTCQYIIDKKSRKEPAIVLKMFKQEGVESATTCTPILNSDQLYTCSCPPSIPHSCLKEMFAQVDTIAQAKPPKFCCNYANIVSTEISSVPSECDRESWKQVESNADCHYVLEKKSSSEPVKVLLLIFNGVKVESSISCKPIDKAVGMYHCHCAASSDRYSNGCLWAMFNTTEEVFKRLSMEH